jgi:hypothetical protein
MHETVTTLKRRLNKAGTEDTNQDEFLDLTRATSQ